jgi:hypothetical protein
MTQLPSPNILTERQRAFQLLQNDLPVLAKQCLKIRDKRGNIVPLVFNRPQLFIHMKLEEQRKRMGFVRAVIMKGRQEGVSTYIGARYFQKTLLRRGTTTFILSHEAKSTGTLFDMTKRYHDNLPAGLSPGLETSNKNQLKFAGTDSEYTVGTAGNEDVGRSMTLKLLHMSEAAFYEHTDELETGLMQAVADIEDTEIIIESTANGLGNFFHERAMRAMAGLGSFQLIFVPWYWQIEYRMTPPEGFAPDETEWQLMKTYGLDIEQVYWRRMKIENTKGGLWKFQQEYPFTPDEAFLMSGETFFSKDSVVVARKCLNRSNKAPRIMGVDCGRENDRSVFVIREGRAVIHYEMHKDLRADGREPTQQLIAIAANLINRWNVDKCFIDFGYGHGLVDGLLTLGYRKEVMGVNFQQQPLDKIRFLNKRAEMAGLARDWLEEGEVSIPDDDVFMFDLLLVPKEKESPTHRMYLLPKREIKAKHKVSPDIFDAFILTFAFPVARRLEDKYGDEDLQRGRKIRQRSKSALDTINRMNQKH